MDSLEIVNAGIQYRSLSVNISDEDKQAGNAANIQSFNGSVTFHADLYPQSLPRSGLSICRVENRQFDLRQINNRSGVGEFQYNSPG